MNIWSANLMKFIWIQNFTISLHELSINISTFKGSYWLPSNKDTTNAITRKLRKPFNFHWYHMIQSKWTAEKIHLQPLVVLHCTGWAHPWCMSTGAVHTPASHGEGSVPENTCSRKISICTFYEKQQTHTHTHVCTGNEIMWALWPLQ